MSGTNYIASNWRVPENSNSSKNDNYSLDFSTTSSTINCGNITALNGKTNASWSFWLNCGTTGINGIMNQWGGSTDRLIYAFIWLANGRIDVYISGYRSFYVNSNAIINALSTGQWFNLIITYDGTQPTTSDRVKVYIDNQELTGNLDFAPASLNNSTTDFVIGTYPSGTYWNGQMSDVALFDYTLDSDQRDLLLGGTGTGAGNPMALKPTPVAYYPLGDNSSGGIDVGPTSILTQPNVSVDDASVFNFNSSSNSFIQANNVNLDSANKFTVSLWLKVTSDSFEEFFSIYTGSSMNFFIGRRAGNRLDIYFGSFIYKSSVLNTNSFDNIIVVFDGTQASNTDKIKCFVNGNPISLSGSTSNTSLPSGSKIIYLGRRGSTYLDGQLSNVAVWNSDQTTEISNIYNSGVPATSYTNTPTAWYKLDQSANWDVGGSGNWTIPDASGNGNDGTSSGMTSGNLVLSDLTKNLPYENYSLNFDRSSSDYIDCGDIQDFDGASQLTVSAWVKVNNTTDTQFIISKYSNNNNRTHIAISSNLIYFNTSNGSSSFGSLAFTSTDWTHIAMVFNGSGSGNSDKLKGYINGVEQTLTFTGTIPTTLADTGANIVEIGRQNTGNYIDGHISNLAIWDTNLSSTEVQKLYANGVPQDLTSFTPQPSNWWTLGKDSFWNGSDWIVRDMIGSSDGTSANMAVNDLVGDAPRSEANGTGTNMDIPTNLVGNAGFSDKNAYSINMGPSARVTDTP